MNGFPPFLQDMIEHPPTAGNGVHQWIFQVAWNLHAHMPAMQIEQLIRVRLSKCGRTVTTREIRSGIKDSLAYAWTPHSDHDNAVRHPPPAAPNLVLIEHLVSHDYKLPDLWNESDHWFDNTATETIIDQMFPGNPLLCCGASATVFSTKTREEWRGKLATMSFIVSSPMTAVTGLTKEGKVSAHTLANTGPRRFLVIEYDFSEFGPDGKTPTIYQPMLRRLSKLNISILDMCANLLLRLNRIRPMTLAVFSGGKSIHGWFPCAGLDESKVKVFHDFAIVRGADPATYRKSQFVRMPDGHRENGKQQSVFFFNPKTIPP